MLPAAMIVPRPNPFGDFFCMCVKKNSESIWGHFTQIIRKGLEVRESHYFPKIPKMSPNGFGIFFYITQSLVVPYKIKLGKKFGKS